MAQSDSETIPDNFTFYAGKRTDSRIAVNLQHLTQRIVLLNEYMAANPYGGLIYFQGQLSRRDCH
jgi:hypothetical protein